MSGYFTEWTKTHLPSKKEVPGVPCVPEAEKMTINNSLSESQSYNNYGSESVPGVPTENFQDKITLEERIAIIQHDAGLSKEWATAFAKMDCMDCCPLNLLEKTWRNIKNNTGIVLDNHVKDLIRSNWTVADIFGVHAAAPGKRYDHMGFLTLLGDSEVIKIENDKIIMKTQTGRELSFYKSTIRNSSEQILIWELKK